VAQLPDIQLRGAGGIALAEEDEAVGLRYCPARGWSLVMRWDPWSTCRQTGYASWSGQHGM